MCLQLWLVNNNRNTQ